MQFELTRENVSQKVHDAIEKFHDTRAENLYRAQIDLANLSSELAYLRREIEKTIGSLECEERRLFIEVTDKHIGGTGKEREARAFSDDRYASKKSELDAAIADARFVSKLLDILETIDEKVKNRAFGQLGKAK